MIAGHETETTYKEEYQFKHRCFVAGSIEGITENIKAINNFLNKILMQADDMHNGSEKTCETLMPGNKQESLTVAHIPQKEL